MDELGIKEVRMAFFTDEEKKKIEEKEEISARVYLKYEKKSSGAAGVLSSVCPGLGQVYNGQMGKASLCIAIVLIGLLLLSAGIFFQVKGMPVREKPGAMIEEAAFEAGEEVEISEEGVIIGAETATEAEQAAGNEAEQECERKPATPVVLMVLGAIGILGGWNYSVKDAIRTAKRINASY